MPAAMDDERGSVSARDIKDEHQDSDDARTVDGKATYKSWKKKYRKMRIQFDQKMHDCEDLHRQESKALATAKRIAIENDRTLEMLLDLNASAQIPADKRIDLSLEPSADTPFPPLDVDVDTVPADAPDRPTKSLRTLLTDVPHFTFSQAKEHSPSVVADMEPFAGETHPPTYLTPDDIDDYIYEIDKRIDPDHLLPTLAPSARSNVSLPESNPHALSQSIAMKNPTSVYNWLRKHAPKTFLQDAENAANTGLDEDNTVETPQTDGRRRRGGARGEGSRGGRGSRGGKRASLAASRAEKAAERAAEKAAIAMQRAAAMREAADNWEGMEEEEDDDQTFTTPATGRGKRKRASARDDDDGGYKPRGSTGRPAKKKRKSEGTDVGTPTVSKRGRKSEASRDRES